METPQIGTCERCGTYGEIRVIRLKNGTTISPCELCDEISFYPERYSLQSQRLIIMMCRIANHIITTLGQKE